MANLRSFKRFFRKDTGTWALVVITLLVGGFSIWTSNLLFQTRNRAVAPNAPESTPEATGNCTLTYSIAAATPTGSAPVVCPAGTVLLFNNALSSLSTSTTTSLNGRVSSLSGSWRVSSQNSRLLASNGTNITVTFPTNVLLHSVLIYDNDPKSGEGPWTINGVSLPTTGDNRWGPLFSLNRTSNQMVFRNNGDSPHFNVCVKSATSGSSPTPGSGTTTETRLNPTADTYVSSSNASTNYGSGSNLRVDGVSPINISYLKFDLSSLAGRTITKAYLRLYVTDRTPGTLNIKRLTNSWSEGSMTYNSRPSLGSLIRSFSSPSSTGTWASVELTTFVNNNKGNVVSFAIDTASSDPMVFNSRNASSNKPYILIQ